MGEPRVLFAFTLTLLAGLATGVGSAIAFFAHRTRTGLLSAALGFSAGVMIYVSFVELLADGRGALVERWGGTQGSWAAVGAFFAGMGLIALIDRLVPAVENPHEVHRVEELAEGEAHPALKRMGAFAALAIAVHNFPEGLATFAAALEDTKVGVSIAFAIALHNIPEGIAVSVPIFYATGSRRRAFVLSFLSGLSEPLGALIGWLFLAPFFGPPVRGLLFAAIAGVMVFISLDELLPTAREYGKPHVAMYGLVGGMAVMAASLLLI